MTRNPFLLKMVSSQESYSQTLRFMEFYDGMPLDAFLCYKISESDTFRMSDTEILQIAYQLILGLSSLHHYNIAHLCIEPKNILVKATVRELANGGMMIDESSSPEDKPDDDYKLKISAFNRIAKFGEKISPYQQITKYFPPEARGILNSENSLNSPEISFKDEKKTFKDEKPGKTKGYKIDEKFDVWSLGQILNEMVFGFAYDDTDLIEEDNDRGRDELPNDNSQMNPAMNYPGI